MADSTTGSSNTQDLNQLLGQSPFGRLLDIQGADGNNLTAQDIFGNLGSGGGNAFGGGAGGAGGAPSNQDLPYGGNPFAGDNFWNIFAGGVNPSNVAGNAPSGGAPSGGGNPFAGGGGAPMSGGGGAPSGGGNPFAGGGGAPSGGGNPFAGGGGAPSGGNPLSGGGGAPSGGGNPFAGGGGAPSGGGNPMSGGGGAPSGGGSNPFAGGGAPTTGGGSNPFDGGGAPSGSPSPTTGENTQDLNALLSQSPFAPLLDIEKADGSKVTAQDIFGNVNLPASSSPLGNGGDPFAGDNFWNTFGGGVNPTTFSSSNIPAFGGGSPQGLPTGASTPVPEPSSVIGIAVIGVGIAATKFRQYQRRTVKAFNK